MRKGVGYTVLMNVGGVPYNMDWPCRDELGRLITVGEALRNVWVWISQESVDGVLYLKDNDKEAKSIVASMISSVDVLRNGSHG